ncbi:hypothetical protein JHW43_007229 [Diplocarpon mali]|nr:hypothetical protein JHW43_007229 [Diplocarpon mali]
MGRVSAPGRIEQPAREPDVAGGPGVRRGMRRSAGRLPLSLRDVVNGDVVSRRARRGPGHVDLDAASRRQRVLVARPAVCPRPHDVVAGLGIPSPPRAPAPFPPSPLPKTQNPNTLCACYNTLPGLLILLLSVWQPNPDPPLGAPYEDHTRTTTRRFSPVTSLLPLRSASRVASRLGLSIAGLVPYTAPVLATQHKESVEGTGHGTVSETNLLGLRWRRDPREPSRPPPHPDELLFLLDKRRLWIALSGTHRPRPLTDIVVLRSRATGSSAFPPSPPGLDTSHRPANFWRVLRTLQQAARSPARVRSAPDIQGREGFAQPPHQIPACVSRDAKLDPAVGTQRATGLPRTSRVGTPIRLHYDQREDPRLATSVLADILKLENLGLAPLLVWLALVDKVSTFGLMHLSTPLPSHRHALLPPDPRSGFWRCGGDSHDHLGRLSLVTLSRRVNLSPPNSASRVFWSHLTTRGQRPNRSALRSTSRELAPETGVSDSETSARIPGSDLNSWMNA